MYVAVNKELCQIVAKHTDFHLLCLFFDLDLKNCIAEIHPVDRFDWHYGRYTTAQLNQYYENLTGQNLNLAMPEISARLLELLNTDLVSEIEPQMLLKQANQNMKNEETRYYCARSSVSSPQQPSYFCEHWVKPSESVLTYQLPQLPVKTQNKQCVTSMPATTKVFEVAQDLWEQNGKPTHVPDLLKLRKTIMDVCETDYLIKRGTASNILAKWQKQILGQF